MYSVWRGVTTCFSLYVTMQNTKDHPPKINCFLSNQAERLDRNIKVLVTKQQQRDIR